MATAGGLKTAAAQWMTAGGGILHQEMPKASPRMLGLQLWINLPRDKKMVHPKYRDITPDDIPVIEEKGVTIRVVTGKYGNIGGATQGEYVDVQFLDVEMGPGGAWEMETIPGNTVFSYLMEGSCCLDAGGVIQPARRARPLLGRGPRTTSMPVPKAPVWSSFPASPSASRGMGRPHRHEYRRSCATRLWNWKRGRSSVMGKILRLFRR